VTAAPPSHRATTAHLQALYPFVSPGPLGGGPLIGSDLLGGPFSFDPWDLYRSGRITNPNVLVLGQLGRGKSSFIKSFVARQLAFGRRAWIIDPKGEYGPLARLGGGSPIRLEAGGRVRLNPLELTGSRSDPESCVRARVELVASLLGSSLRRPLGPEERTAVEMAVRRVSAGAEPPTLPALVEALLEPDVGAAASVHTDRAGLAADGRIPALELRRMVRGDLAGLFDGPTTTGLGGDQRVVVLDLSATFSSPALPLIMTCATAWLQASLTAGPGVKRLVVVDEAWAILNDLATARWAQATFKLSRALGVANLVVVHRVSDLRSAGDDGSAEQKLADGLLADSETRVVFGQSPAEAEQTGRWLGLARTEIDLVPRLPRGVALWRVGGRSHIVRHLLGDDDHDLVDTDGAMRP
jgi:type IV secretory pathway VirB4 component